MPDKDVIDFIEKDIIDVTIVAVKDEGTFKGIYRLYLTGYIKELPGIIVQEDSWDKEKLIACVENLYDVVREHNIEKGITLPEKLNYTVEYVDMEQFLNK